MPETKPLPQNESTTAESNQIKTSSDCWGSKPFSEWPEVMTHSDIMSCLGISHNHAWQMLKNNKLQRPFPADKRGMIAGKYALRDFINGRIILEEKS